MKILDIQTTDTPANFINDILRGLGHGFFNRTMFWFLGIIYQIFFNVATVEILENATIRNFYGRIQLILGVFMVFRLSITVLQAIVDPDRAQNKSEGFAAIIKRVVIGLVMLTVLTPINIPGAKNDFEKEINNNGIMFGILYDLQYRILDQNTLGRLILGTTDDANDATSDTLANSHTIFTSTLAKAFVSINLKEGKTDETKSANWMCKNIDKSIIDEYQKLDIPPSQLFSNQWVTLSCTDESNSWVPFSGVTTRATGKDRYVFSYILFLPFIIALVFSIVLLGFTVDIAIRAFKLVILRLIAPIPIIAYMGPESKDNTAFNNWIKAVVSTYLDLFIRLAIVYFVIYLIMDMITNGVVMREGLGIVGIFSMIFIWLGLFLFARQAPKFILDVLGVKSLGSNVGLGSIVGGLGMFGGGFRTGMATSLQERYGTSSLGKIAHDQGFGRALMAGLSSVPGGFVGAGSGYAQGALSGMLGSNEAQATGKDLPLHNIFSQNRDLMAQMRTGDKDARGGFTGYLQDRANFQNRELRARSLGIGRNAMAAALYEDEVAGDRYRTAQANSASLASKVSAMKGTNGTVKTKDELAVAYGRSVTDAEYSSFVDQFNQTYKEWQDALDLEEKARVQTLITGAAKKSMDGARSTMGVGPRAADIYTTGYRSQRQVRMTDDRVAVRRDDSRITDPEQVVDPKHRGVGEAYRNQYTFEDSVTSFDGTIDDSSFGSSGRGSGS